MLYARETDGYFFFPFCPLRYVRINQKRVSASNVNRLNLELNILKTHLQGMKGREAKVVKELFCVFIFYKMRFSSSAVFHLTTYSLRRDLQIGAKKANRLFHQIQASDMCHVVKNNDGSLNVWIKSFKVKSERKESRKGIKYRVGIFMRFPFGECTLKDLYCLMNEMLVTTPIAKSTSSDGYDCSQMGQRGNKKTSLFSSADDYRGVTIGEFSKVLHVSKSSASRIKANVVKKGWLNYIPCRQYTELVDDEESCKKLLAKFNLSKPTFVHHGLMFIIRCASYSLIAEKRERNVALRFYNYKDRNPLKNYAHNSNFQSTIPQLCGF